ncbi:MAG: class I SAM-dependent methyltransferase [bacterium]
MDLLDPLRQIPWITFDAKLWLDRHVNESMSIFEWGSGGSTLYFAKHARQVVSVDHNADWYQTVLATLSHEKLKNAECFLIPPQQSVWARFLPYTARTYVSRTFIEHRNLRFRSYVRKIESYRDGTFDLVMIDGRARAACLFHAVRKIKRGGYMVLDNAERPHYQSAMRRLSGLSRQDFCGHGPSCAEPWQTTIWRIP